MITNILRDKPTRLFIILSGILVANALIAEIIGVKIFSLEATLGLQPANLMILGETYSFNMTAGVLLWPVVFIMTDIINEYYGMKGVRFLSFLAAGLILFAFIIFFFAIRLTPAEFFVTMRTNSGVPDMDKAYQQILGQGSFIIVASLTAFLLGQLVDVFTFHRIKKVTGEKRIWLRATGSTLISQLIDSFVVLFVAFYLLPLLYNPNNDPVWSLGQVLAVCIINYIYKFTAAIVLTPVIYWVHGILERYLGHSTAAEMKRAAMNR
ncbi:queuosine precursor transporter [Chitinophaga sp. GCM10012297]|uniref:Probable queuosine precursor transporter n=1 Tax=Chitinophaga chungangae TaxID=2821488 RepID=A0ABS3YCN2_9BACT|nr:queuosine precursor transporter [Chitinophaga chungangae]MBO9151884.1 queuosine precursor transporter [Chitinophaga chungangae]